MRNELILIIEDDRETRALLKIYLDREGYRTVEASDGEIGLAHHWTLKPDLVILDVSLPRRDGFDVLAEIRRRGHTPVIMVTGRGKPIDELQGYRCGADDYIAKPFEPDLVVAHTNAVLGRGGDRTANLPIRLGKLTVDQSARTAWVDQPTGRKDLKLTPTEFKLIYRMARSPGRLFERPELTDECNPDDPPLERTIDSHMYNLRSKLNAAGLHGMLVSRRGVGYRMDNTHD
ncbi:response regulator transcription factor [Rhizobium brockwellii]|jgi:two-component system response regulator AdeR|uniref:Response regulator transcription factor n=2 Tax=Rhizobium TaxID=379 RepID=A0ABU3YY42_9HYPH|nr:MULTISPECIES: response regulator transcription factor [Rhizobium]MDV4183782.1 response regulator transcription factor [Rhizobium brockwellii]MDV4190774.1 response regulator transcription factor [Rhizobium brockwellii]NEI82000.1 response regulator [Rhizobium ruizarguesonis]NZD54829.1 response regulator transcription factor [Rhizobium leguminosarum]QIO63464.1 response regulator transcription factor [Rhizobium leguminosarum bv. trifolii]